MRSISRPLDDAVRGSKGSNFGTSSCSGELFRDEGKDESEEGGECSRDS